MLSSSNYFGADTPTRNDSGAVLLDWIRLGWSAIARLVGGRVGWVGHTSDILNTVLCRIVPTNPWHPLEFALLSPCAGTEALPDVVGGLDGARDTLSSVREMVLERALSCSVFGQLPRILARVCL